jgi:hypothetical protein
LNNTYTYISTAATTIVRSVKGRLHTLIVQGGTAGTIIGYDSASAASGNIVFSFDSTNAIATYVFDCDLANGLVIVTSQATKVTAMTSPQVF